MELKITVTGHDHSTALHSLGDWCRNDGGLRGLVATQSSPTSMPGCGETVEMGSLSDALMVTVGSTGTVAALARVISAWFTSKSRDVTVVISGKKEEVTVDVRRAKNLDEVEQLIKRVVERS